jgi:hypothetical protein
MDRKISRREYLISQSILRGTPLMLAVEAVSTTAIEHPEWDMAEERTWDEWAAS